MENSRELFPPPLPRALEQSISVRCDSPTEECRLRFDDQTRRNKGASSCQKRFPQLPRAAVCLVPAITAEPADPCRAPPVLPIAEGQARAPRPNAFPILFAH